jgi:8-oxo-dGTP pyrophosphatase MutT (NUDIX family)
MTDQPTDPVRIALDRHVARTVREVADVARVRHLLDDGQPWDRSTALHTTASAFVVHPETGRVLLRWHERQQRWLQVGGHADPGEQDPFTIACREAHEETGLTDLSSWPDPSRPVLLHVAIVPVPAGKGEPDHEHADLRFVLATSDPDAAVPETASASLRWLSIMDAAELADEPNVIESLRRIDELFA